MLMNNWLSELTNYEEDDVEISFFSLDEEALTIQSSYFFSGLILQFSAFFSGLSISFPVFRFFLKARARSVTIGMFRTGIGIPLRSCRGTQVVQEEALEML